MHQLLNGHKFEQTPGDSGGHREPGLLNSTVSQRARQDLVAEQQLYMYIRLMR